MSKNGPLPQTIEWSNDWGHDLIMHLANRDANDEAGATLLLRILEELETTMDCFCEDIYGEWERSERETEDAVRLMRRLLARTDDSYGAIETRVVDR